jgi:hypothetical protein
MLFQWFGFAKGQLQQDEAVVFLAQRFQCFGGHFPAGGVEEGLDVVGEQLGAMVLGEEMLQGGKVVKSAHGKNILTFFVSHICPKSINNENEAQDFYKKKTTIFAYFCLIEEQLKTYVYKYLGYDHCRTHQIEKAAKKNVADGTGRKGTGQHQKPFTL